MSDWPVKLRFRVGLLVMASATLFVALVAFILGSSVSSDRSIYYVHFEENVKGMVVGSKVNFQGVPIGSVTDIRFEHGLSLVEITIDPAKAELQDVTRARLDRLLVTGQVTIELEGYERNARSLAAGAVIRTQASPITELARTLPETVQEVSQLLEGLQKLIASLDDLMDADNRDRVSRILANLDAATALLPDRLDGVLTNASEAAASLRRTGDALVGVVESDDVRGVLASARRAADRVDEMQDQVSALVRELAGVVTSSRRTWLETLVAARGALDEMHGLARLLRVSPSALVFGREVREPSAAPAGGNR